MQGLHPAVAAILLSMGSFAAQAPLAAQVSAPQTTAGKGDAGLDTITVEARRAREILEHQVDAYVTHIAVRPFEQSLARWRAPVCPLVAGLPRDSGEYMLRKLSAMATAAGVPLAPTPCQANLEVVFTAVPDELIKAFAKRGSTTFGDAGGMQIREFLKAPNPIKAWYNTDLHTAMGSALVDRSAALAASGTRSDGSTPFNGIPNDTEASATRLQHNEVRDLSSVLVVVDSRRAQGISFGQLAAYVAMAGFAELRLHADLGDAPSILQLFAAPEKAPPALSPWDEAYLKALYQTEQSDINQLGAMRLSILKDLEH